MESPELQDVLPEIPTEETQTVETAEPQKVETAEPQKVETAEPPKKKQRRVKTPKEKKPRTPKEKTPKEKKLKKPKKSKFIDDAADESGEEHFADMDGDVPTCSEDDDRENEYDVNDPFIDNGEIEEDEPPRLSKKERRALLADGDLLVVEETMMKLAEEKIKKQLSKKMETSSKKKTPERKRILVSSSDEENPRETSPQLPSMYSSPVKTPAKPVKNDKMSDKPTTISPKKRAPQATQNVYGLLKSTPKVTTKVLVLPSRVEPKPAAPQSAEDFLANAKTRDNGAPIPLQRKADAEVPWAFLMPRK